jgi:alanyl-tRNA synthetase
MGDVGPCGPCSEIHIDLRDQSEIDLVSGKSLVNNDHPQVVEIWNNVFMQFERKADGSLLPLSATHVDTGMGFERLCMAIQGKKSNYDTDIFQNTITVLEAMSGFKYGVNGTLSSDSYVDVAMRVIADHLRAVAFTIADGQLPSNAKAGYVVRRILRRAIRYGFSYLNLKEPFMCKLVPVLATQFKDVFPELQAQVEFVTKVVEEEEKSFLRTLDLGIKRFDTISPLTPKGGTIDGNIVFELSDTYGFPVDLTALLAKEKGLLIDEIGFEKALNEQKNRSRKDSSKEASDWVEVNAQEQDFEFLGYEQLSAETTIIKYRKVKTKIGEEYQIVFDKSPFYAEMGGQVGDTGTLTINGKAISISDTKKENDIFVHIATEKNLEEFLETTSIVKLEVSAERRSKIMANHTATHLMLSAMRQVLGTHIIQKGSYQNDVISRFDFSHFAKVTDEELGKIEDIVNEKIRQNIPLQYKVNVPIDEAIKMGATATFGEKYGDFVRLVIFDPSFSLELCGGTHVQATGQIGLFKFISEGSVSAGVRRVEAITGVDALNLFDQHSNTVNEIREIFKGQADIVKSVKTLLEERNVLLKKIEKFEKEKLQAQSLTLLESIIQRPDFQLIVAKVEVEKADDLKTICFELKGKTENLVVALGANIDGKPSLAVMVVEALITSKGLNAGALVREMAKEIKGGGGGQPSFAAAGGSDLSGLDRALTKI